MLAKVKFEEKTESEVVLITGASRGIGRTVAVMFAKQCYDIVFTYNNSKKEAQELEKEILAHGVKCLAVKCDLSKDEEVENLVKTAINAFGKIDVLVNNAGVCFGALFQDKTTKDFRKTLDVNLVGLFYLSKLVGLEMKKNKKGKIINIASTNGMGMGHPTCVDYDASKAGVISVTRNLAMALAPFVTVNCVAPGFIATKSELEGMDDDMLLQECNKIFVRRPGSETDVGNLVLFLASPKANYINGAVIRIDGGM